MTAAGILNHVATAAQTLTAKNAAPTANSTTGTSGSSSSSSSSSASATISANDFLTLLVTEMQNQDPTSDTDPNEYIDQLVNVNSLEQLIDINQTLSTALGSTSSSTTTKDARSTTGAASASSGAGTTHGLAAATGSLTASPLAPAGVNSRATQSASGHVAGNLSVPGASISSRRVAHALDGRTHAPAVSGGAIAAQ
ncbi:MAG: flagellar hook capping FlgD N-terminal domain-containing protein [Terracidiphilus sp.]